MLVLVPSETAIRPFQTPCPPRKSTSRVSRVVTGVRSPEPSTWAEIAPKIWLPGTLVAVSKSVSV